MTTALREDRDAVDAVISENVNTLLHRAHMSASAMGRRLGITKQTMARKMLGGPWFYAEVRAIADLFDVTTDELAGSLPSAVDWRARRDSNPQPSDWVSGPLLRLVWSVKSGLTANRRTPDAGTRHLRAVS